MHNALDLFGIEVCAKRKKLQLTQQQLATKLNMSVRTIIQLENCKSNPKFETVVLIAKELDISLDAILFPNTKPNSVSKSVVDFFAGKSEADAQKYISLCQQADILRNNK